MGTDDLLCSRNARSRTPFVGRAQWKINQPPSLLHFPRTARSDRFLVSPVPCDYFVGSIKCS
jgi:hypothetical protein